MFSEVVLSCQLLQRNGVLFREWGALSLENRNAKHARVRGL